MQEFQTIGLLKHSTNLSLKRNDDDEGGEVFCLATTVEFQTKLLNYDSTYDEEVPLDDEFWIDIRCEYLRDINTNNILKHNVDNNSDSEENEEDIEELEEVVEIRRLFLRPIQGFPSSYEEAWHVVYKWVKKELNFLKDSYVLPVLTEELTNRALYLVNEIPKEGKEFVIQLDAKIHEIRVLPPPPNNNVSSTSTSSFIIEVAVLETVEDFKCHYNKFKKSKRLKRQVDKELVINVYTTYKPIGSETGICKVHKCTHPANELWDLDSYALADIVSMMLKQVDLPGEFPRVCLFNETLERVEELMDYDCYKPLELNVAIRITEILHPTASATSMEDGASARLKVHPYKLFTPLRSCHIRPNT